MAVCFREIDDLTRAVYLPINQARKEIERTANCTLSNLCVAFHAGIEHADADHHILEPLAVAAPECRRLEHFVLIIDTAVFLQPISHFLFC